METLGRHLDLTTASFEGDDLTMPAEHQRTNCVDPVVIAGLTPAVIAAFAAFMLIWNKRRNGK